MAAQPGVGAQAVQHFQVGQRAEFQAHGRDARVRALVVGGRDDRARHVGRGRVAREGREHVGAPPGVGQCEVFGRVAARVDLLAVAVGAQARVHVDPAQVRGRGGVFAQDLADGAVAPRRRGAAVEQAVRRGVLALGHGRAEGCHAVLLDVGAHGRLVGRRGRPACRQHQRLDLGIRGVHRQRRIEVDVVAVQVDVVFVGAVQVRKTVRVDGMHQQQRHAGLFQAREQVGVVQRGDLRAGAAEAFGAVRARGHEQQLLRVDGADQRDVGGQLFAECAAVGLEHERFDGRAALGGGLEELGAGFDVRAREMPRGGGALGWHEVGTPVLGMLGRIFRPRPRGRPRRRCRGPYGRAARAGRSARRPSSPPDTRPVPACCPWRSAARC